MEKECTSACIFTDKNKKYHEIDQWTSAMYIRGQRASLNSHAFN